MLIHIGNRQGDHNECIKYLDGTLYNLKHKVTELSANARQETGIDPSERERAFSKLTLNNKILKLRLQAKLNLQMCAMLSQINKY